MPGFDLRKGESGAFFVHWTEGGRSRRVSTRERDPHAAEAFLAAWLENGRQAALLHKRAPRVAFSYSLQRGISGRFYVHWCEDGRTKRVSTRSRDPDEAKAFMIARMVNVATPQNPTCETLWQIYMRDHVEPRCASTETHRYAWARLHKRFGALTPRQVTRDLVQEHVRARKAKPSSLHVELRLMVASWRYGVRRGLMTSDLMPIVDNLEIPRPPRPRERWLRENEVARIFAAAAEMRRGPRISRLERFIRIALETGGRRQAIMELKWDQIDFEARVLHLNPDGRVQTSKKRASVPISEALMDVLEQAYDERISDFVMDHTARMPDALKALGIRANVPGLTHHVFRHTTATWLARRSVPLWKIAKILGNSVEQIERTYAKHCLDDLRDSVNLISRPTSKPPPSPPPYDREPPS